MMKLLATHCKYGDNVVSNVLGKVKKKPEIFLVKIFLLDKSEINSYFEYQRIGL